VLKRLAASCFETFGLELRRLPDAAGRDPFLYMKSALQNVPSPVIFDVGANVGQSITRFRCLWPQSVIHAFEPGRTSFSELQRRTAGAERVHLTHAAVGASAGWHEFQENSQGDMSSFLDPSQDAWGTIVDRYEVPVTTVDLYRAERSVPRVDILKIDTQGFDLHVLHGARGSLEQGQVRFVLLELIFASLYQGQARVDEVFRFLMDHQMHLVGIYDFHFVHDLAGWADALFVGVPPATTSSAPGSR
jgi:FkbM family methyltransferase